MSDCLNKSAYNRAHFASDGATQQKVTRANPGINVHVYIAPPPVSTCGRHDKLAILKALAAKWMVLQFKDATAAETEKRNIEFNQDCKYWHEATERPAYLKHFHTPISLQSFTPDCLDYCNILQLFSFHWFVFFPQIQKHRISACTSTRSKPDDEPRLSLQVDQVGRVGIGKGR